MNYPQKRRDPARLVVIVPCWNEELVLRRTVQQLVEWKSGAETHFGLSIRVVVADNGSTDATPRIAQELVDRYSGVEYQQIPARGRGQALRSASMRMDADYTIYVDADLPITLSRLTDLVGHLVSGRADVVVGRRSGPRPFLRRVMTASLRLCIGLVSNVRVQDIQCGIKGWSRAVAEHVIGTTQESGFFWDTELLIRADAAGYTVHEVDVDWVERRYRERKSTVRPIIDSARALRALLRIWKRVRTPGARNAQMLFACVCFTWVVWMLYVQRVSWALGEGVLVADFLAIHVGWLIVLMVGLVALPVATYIIIPYVLRVLPVRRVLAMLIACALVVWSLATLVQPMAARDVYWNVSHGQSWVELQRNPYLQSLTEVRGELWYGGVIEYEWLPMTHGPVWVWILGAAVWVGGSGYASMIVLKVFACVAYGVTIYLITRMPRYAGQSMSRRMQVLALLLLSPASIFFSIVDVHNDVYVMLGLTAAVYAMVRQRYEWAIYAFWFAGMVKYFPLLLLGIPVIAILRSEHTRRSKVITLVRSALVLFVVTAVLYAPFGYSLGLLTGVNDEFSSRFYVFFASPPVAALMLYFGSAVLLYVRVFGLSALLAIAYGYAIRKKYDKGITIGVGALLLLGTPWLLGWYGIWVLPLATVLYPTVTVFIHIWLTVLGVHIAALQWVLLLALFVLAFYLLRLSIPLLRDRNRIS